MAKVLIVEDESIVAKDIQNKLEDLDHDVVGIVSAGEKVIQAVRETNPDLVLMDIRLEGEMDGIQASEELKQFFDLPVVFLSSYSNVNTLKRAKIAEPYGYLLKPYEDRELSVAIDLAIYKHSVEKRIKVEKRRYEEILISMPESIITTDPRGKIIFMNPEAEKLFGCKADEAIGQPIYRIIDVQNSTVEDIIEIYIRKIFLSGQRMVIPGANTLVNKIGQRFDVCGTISPLGDGLGSLSGLLFNFSINCNQPNADDCYKQSELTMQSIIIASMEPLIQTNERGLITLFNPAAERLLQYEQNEVLNKDINLIFAEKNVSFNLPVLDHYFDNGKGWYGKVKNQSEFKLVKKDGSFVNAEISVAGGKHLEKRFYVITIHDLTDRTFRQSEILHAVESEKNAWLEVINKLPIIVYILEPGYSIWVNDYAIQITGYQINEWNAFAKAGLIKSLGANPEAEDEMNENLRKMSPGNNGIGFHTEFPIRTKSGREITLFCTETPITFNENGEPTKILGTGVDISERKFAEMIIRSSEERFRNFFNTVDIPLALFSIGGDIIQTNQAFSSALGYIPAEMTGLNFSLITPAEDYINELNTLKNAINNAEFFVKNFNKRFIHKNGSILSAEATFSFIIDSSNQPKYGICVVKPTGK